jgi:predicted aspartyl protease
VSGPTLNPACLTVDFGNLARVIVTKAGIAHHFLAGPVPNIPFHECKAIWDTGASATVITNRAVAAAGLKPVSMTMTRGVHGEKMANVYLASLRLPNNVVFNALRVTEGDLGPDVDVLIGMDVISMGDFSVTNLQGKTTFSFRLPSMQRVDFTTLPLPKPAPTISHNNKPGRNDPCPCGSGKKYKQCCIQ